MNIDLTSEIKREVGTMLEDATKYNGDIFRFTLSEGSKIDNYGDIVKYVDEEVKTLEDMKVVFIALINGLNRED